MAQFYSPEDANELLPELASVTARLRDQREQLVTLRDAYRRREAAVGGGAATASHADDSGSAEDDGELRRIRLRMRGIVDQMQADVAWLDERSIMLRDIPTGLLDLPARAGDRQVWLCWQLGEDAVSFWHTQEDGFAGRLPLAYLDDGASPA
jgi:hypothetical protein